MDEGSECFCIYTATLTVNMKPIANFKAVILPVIFLIACFGCNNTANPKQAGSASCWTRVYETDSILSIKRNEDCKRMPLAAAIGHYLDEAKKITYEDCSLSFKESFLAHLQAWEKLKPIADKYPLLRGELHEVFGLIQRTSDSALFNQYVNDIHETWKHVESKATQMPRPD